MRITAEILFNALLSEMETITFCLGDVRSLAEKDADFGSAVVSMLAKEWLQGWFDKREIEYAPSDNTQMPPDFYLNPDDKTAGLLEIKAFNRNAAPGFDIADFRAYTEELVERPYMLYADYLIFGYDMGGDGIVTVKDVWLKKVWEITRRMKGWPLNLQIKKGVVHKIRPGAWYSGRKGNIPVFRNAEHFLAAIAQTAYLNMETRKLSQTWVNDFQTAYRKLYKRKIAVPRWEEIEGEYE